jgi:hypothetical protein
MPTLDELIGQPMRDPLDEYFDTSDIGPDTGPDFQSFIEPSNVPYIDRSERNAAIDFLGQALWSFADVGLFSVPSLIAPHEIEEDLYGKYLKLLKSGDLAPNTSFERFEKLYHDFGVDIISKKKRLDDQILSSAIAKIDDAMSGISGISSMGGGGSVKNKPREPKIKKLNLAQYFKLGMTIAELTPHERELVNDLLKKTINPKSDN